MHLWNSTGIVVVFPADTSWIIEGSFAKPEALELWACRADSRIRLMSNIVAEWELKLLKKREFLCCLLNSFIWDTQAWDEPKALQTGGPTKIAQGLIQLPATSHISVIWAMTTDKVYVRSLYCHTHIISVHVEDSRDTKWANGHTCKRMPMQYWQQKFINNIFRYVYEHTTQSSPVHVMIKNYSKHSLMNSLSVN